MSMTKWLELSAQSIALGIVGKHLIGTLFRYPLTYPKRVKNSLCFKKLSRKTLSLSISSFNGDPSAGPGPGAWRLARGPWRAHGTVTQSVRCPLAPCHLRSGTLSHAFSFALGPQLNAAAQLSPSLSRNLPVYLYRRGSSRSITASGTTLNPGGAMKKETRLGRRSSSRPTTLYTGTIECGICDRDYMLRRGCQCCRD